MRRIIRDVDPALAAMAHGGKDAYRDNHELVTRRESARPNDIWQADHTELDIMILDERAKPARPWLTGIIDDHSRAIPGYTVFLGAPTAHQTALALHQAIWHKTDPDWPVCGIPSVLYVDHGADFTSTHIAQVAADLHLQLIHSSIGIPPGRGKGERIFGSITTQLLPTLPGHIPPGNNGQPITEPALTLPQLDAAIGEWITGTYHQKIHPKPGKRPWPGGPNPAGCRGCPNPRTNSTCSCCRSPPREPCNATGSTCTACATSRSP